MKWMCRCHWLTAWLVLCAVLAAMTGCGAYQMRGVVIEGAASTIRIVDQDDPRLLEGYALPMATVDAALDADRLNRKQLPRDITAVDGSFSIPVNETGAGYLNYYARIVVRRNGYNTAVGDIRIPPPDKRVLVTLAPGEDRYRSKSQDVVDETMKMGEPYMR